MGGGRLLLLEGVGIGGRARVQGFLLGGGNVPNKAEGVVPTLNVLNATELFTLKEFILHDASFTSK